MPPTKAAFPDRGIDTMFAAEKEKGYVQPSSTEMRQEPRMDTNSHE